MTFKPPPKLAPYDPLFDDAWLKWGWAVHRGVALKAELEALLDTYLEESIQSSTEYDPRLHAFTVKISNLGRWDRLGLLYGEVLHSYRSALDNAAWAIVRRGSRPPDSLSEWQRRHVAFPCITQRPIAKPKKTSRELLSGIYADRVPGASRADLAAVRWAQPYTYTSHRMRARSVLAFIEDNNNLDKHKTLQPVQAAMYDFLPGDILTWDCVVTRVTPTRSPSLLPLEVGTELARIYVRLSGHDPEIQMPECKVGTTIVFSRYLPGAMFIEQTRDWFAQLLRCFSECPADLGQRLGLES